MKTKKQISFDSVSFGVHQLSSEVKDALIVDLLHLAFLEYDPDPIDPDQYNVATVNQDKDQDSDFIGSVCEVLWHHAGQRVLGDN